MQELRLNLDCDLKLVKIIVVLAPAQYPFIYFMTVVWKKLMSSQNPGRIPWDSCPTLL